MVVANRRDLGIGHADWSPVAFARRDDRGVVQGRSRIECEYLPREVVLQQHFDLLREDGLTSAVGEPADAVKKLCRGNGGDEHLIRWMLVYPVDV